MPCPAAEPTRMRRAEPLGHGSDGEEYGKAKWYPRARDEPYDDQAAASGPRRRADEPSILDGALRIPGRSPRRGGQPLGMRHAPNFEAFPARAGLNRS
jgi:hypothetical protein